MTHDVSISLEDLEGAINYLEGLEVILRRMHIEKRGIEGPDILVQELDALEFAVGEWAPIRYQDGVGNGWLFVAENLAELRHRLVVRYGNEAP